jgi:hypothetical protein
MADDSPDAPLEGLSEPRQRAVKRRIAEIEDAFAQIAGAKRRKLEGEECAPIEAMPVEVIRHIFRMMPRADKRACAAASKRIFMTPCLDLRPPLRPFVRTCSDMLLLRRRMDAPVCTGRIVRDSLVIHNISRSMLAQPRNVARVFDCFDAIIVFGVYADASNDDMPIAQALSQVLGECRALPSFPPKVYFVKKLSSRGDHMTSATLKLRRYFGTLPLGTRGFFTSMVDLTCERGPLHKHLDFYAANLLTCSFTVDETGVYSRRVHGDATAELLKALRRSPMRCVQIQICLRRQRSASIPEEQLLANLQQSAVAVLELPHITDLIQRSRDMPPISCALMQSTLDQRSASATGPLSVRVGYEPLKDGLVNDPTRPTAIRQFNLLRTYTDFN